MNANDQTFLEFRAYWKLSEEMIADATKEDLVDAARILAMQAAHFAVDQELISAEDIARLAGKSLSRDS